MAFFGVQSITKAENIFDLPLMTITLFSAETLTLPRV